MLEVMEAQDFSKIEAMSMSELSERKIDFGKAHVGKTYGQVWETEKTWMKKFVKTFGGSEKFSHRAFLYFVELKVERAEIEKEWGKNKASHKGEASDSSWSVAGAAWDLDHGPDAIAALDARVTKLEQAVKQLTIYK